MRLSKAVGARVYIVWRVLGEGEKVGTALCVSSVVTGCIVRRVLEKSKVCVSLYIVFAGFVVTYAMKRECGRANMEVNCWASWFHGGWNDVLFLASCW